MADRVQTGRSAAMSATFYTGEDVADPGDTTVTVTDDTGTGVASGDATVEDDNSVSYTLPAQDTVGLLTVTWGSTNTGTLTQQVEVAGGFYFDLFELRQLPDVRDETDYPTDRLIAARGWIEGLIDSFCGTSFVERFHKRTFPACGPFMIDPYTTTVFSVRYGDTDLDVRDLEVADGLLRYATGARLSPTSRLTVRYAACCTPPEGLQALKDAALAAARMHLIDQHGESGYSSRVTSTSNEFGAVTRFAAPGPDNPTGLPDVDEVLRSYRRHRVPSVA